MKKQSKKKPIKDSFFKMKIINSNHEKNKELEKAEQCSAFVKATTILKYLHIFSEFLLFLFQEQKFLFSILLLFQYYL